MLGRDFEDEVWTRFVFELVIWPNRLLWKDELNPRVRCAFGNVFKFKSMSLYCSHWCRIQKSVSHLIKYWAVLDSYKKQDLSLIDWRTDFCWVETWWGRRMPIANLITFYPFLWRGKGSLTPIRNLVFLCKLCLRIAWKRPTSRPHSYCRIKQDWWTLDYAVSSARSAFKS